MVLHFFLCLLCFNVSLAAPPSPHAYLKAKEVNWRAGPGYEHPIQWMFTECIGWPVVIRKKCWHWYYVEDVEGYRGWVHAHLLSFKRMILIVQDKVALRSSPKAQSPVVAYLRKGVTGKCKAHKPGWYRLSVSSYQGWVPESACWEPK